MWDTDLADVSNLKSHNDGYIFLLVIIDDFSRKAWVTPLKDKKASSIIKAFKPIIEKEKPVIIRSDRGSEFKNRYFSKFCKENDIIHVGSLSNNKASFAESFIGKLKNIMYRYFESKLTYKYLDVLQDLVHAYNKRPHSSLYGMSPNEINEDTQYIIWQRMYAKPAKRKFKKLKYKYKIGQKVRLTHLKRPFDRGYEQKWTEEIFIVSHRYTRNGIPVYKVTEISSEPITGTFYTAELQAVDKDDQSLYKIEKILKRRTVKGQKQILVHWLGYPKSYDSWIPDPPPE
ncbi:MAG: DDE-type integrase/transposase/recombinase [Candidatus Thiodiazotropha sp.]